jgi:DNA-binding XRE family transcriptional regulator
MAREITTAPDGAGSSQPIGFAPLHPQENSRHGCSEPYRGDTVLQMNDRDEYEERFPDRGSRAAAALASNIRRLRLAKGWTQGDLAAAIEDAHIQQPAISHIENGRANPSLLLLEKLAGALDVAFVELFATPPKRPKKKT